MEASPAEIASKCSFFSMPWVAIHQAEDTVVLSPPGQDAFLPACCLDERQGGVESNQAAAVL
jgi:hypothetical protein